MTLLPHSSVLPSSNLEESRLAKWSHEVPPNQSLHLLSATECAGSDFRFLCERVPQLHSLLVTEKGVGTSHIVEPQLKQPIVGQLSWPRQCTQISNFQAAAETGPEYVFADQRITTQRMKSVCIPTRDVRIPGQAIHQ